MPLPAYTTAAEVLQRLADELGMEVAQFTTDAPSWTRRADRAVAAAAARITRTLAAKGYTEAQMTADAGVAEFCGRLACAYAMTAAATVVEVNRDAIKEFREAAEKELAEWPVLTASNEQAVGAQVVAGGPLAGWADERARFRAMGSGASGYTDSAGVYHPFGG